MLAISTFSDGKCPNTLNLLDQCSFGSERPNKRFNGNNANRVYGTVQTQGRNIRHYTNYLSERARAYRDTKCDFVRGGDRRLEKMSVEKGLLRETEVVQHQITALLKCDVSMQRFKMCYFTDFTGSG